MWSIVSSMRLLRKPSKRGEGDIEGNKTASTTTTLPSKELANGGGNGRHPPNSSHNSGKVERRESTRLGSGASKFLRSLRSGHHNLAGPKEGGNGTTESVNVIALKEFDSENIGGDVRGQSGQENPRLPERSQSFQEKRGLTVAGAAPIPPPPQSSSSRTSLITSTPHHHKQQSTPINSNPRAKHSRAQSFICPSNSVNSNLTRRPEVSLCPDPRKIPEQIQPRETIYENLEVIREHKLNRGTKSNSKYPSEGKGSSSNSGMTVPPKESNQRRPARKIIKDSNGFEQNFSHYANIEETRRGVGVSNDNAAEATTTSNEHSKNPCQMSSDNGKISSGAAGRTGICKETSVYDQVNGNSGGQGADGRKLRRSISEVPPERMSLSKLQSKAKDTSRTIYSSISNGLSIWNVEKSGWRTEAGKNSAAYSIYSQGVQLHTSVALPTSTSSTLPRQTNHIKSSSSLRRAVESSSTEKPAGNNSPFKVIPPPPLSPARSAPNLQQQQQLYNISHQRSLNNLNQIYQNPPIPRPGPPNSPHHQNIYNLSTHTRQLSNPNLQFSNLEISNDKTYEETVQSSYPGSQPQQQQQQQQQPGTMSISNNPRQNNNNWTGSNEPMLNTTPPFPCSPLSSAPVRDASSLKTIRYGPGHEKYPSWPIPVSSAAQIDPAGELNNGSLSSTGSSRSKSWTDQTDYPKEKPPSYARPYMKKMNHVYTQQLKTVMEKCERIPPETFGGVKGGTENGFAGILPPPMGYRDFSAMYNGRHNLKGGSEGQILSSNGGKEYNIPSPPERDVMETSKPFTQDDLEQYEKKYEEMMSQYSHSEGYHSYISSECSSYVGSGTPFLDQLCRESESNQEFWSGDICDPNDSLFGVGNSGRESVTTVVTNSSSNSSGNETLKWHGSTGDLSVSASVSSTNSRGWEQQGNVAHSAKLQTPRKISPDGVLLHSNGNGSRHIKAKLESPTKQHGSSAPNLKKFPLSTYTRPAHLSFSGNNMSNGNSSSPKNDKLRSHDSSLSDKSNPVRSPTKPTSQVSKSPIIDTSKPPTVAERILELEQQQQQQSHSLSSLPESRTTKMSLPATSQAATAPVSLSNGHINVHSSIVNNMKSSSLSSLRESKKAVPQHPQPFKKSSGSGSSSSSSSGEIPTKKSSSGSSEGYQNFWSGFTPDSSSTSCSSGSPPVSYTYLDTEKKHKVADLTLKAIQKKALLAYYERHTGKAAVGEPMPLPRGPISQGGHGNLTQSPRKDTDQSANVLEKDFPFPPSALTLSLPRDIERLKNSLSPTPQSEEFGGRKDGNGNYGGLATNSKGSSQSAKGGTSPCQGSQGTASESRNSKGDKGEVGRVGLGNSQHEELNGESARMAYMSKYLPHLASRETNNGSMPTWSGVTMTSPPTTPCGGNDTSSDSLPVTPPERPPKKPHLRNVAQQSIENGLEWLSPPPPLPRAPIRPPQSSSSSSSSSSSLGILGPPLTPPPPLPSKPIPRCPSPELPPPPPPPTTMETDDVEVLNDDPLPPPPSPMEVHNLVGSRSRSVSGLSSYLHKESYLAQRKERSLGYEGRYRRTLSPSGLGNKSPSDPSTHQQSMSNSTSTGKLDSTLSPSAWEKYHNIRAPSTTVIFTSQKIPHSPPAQQHPQEVAPQPQQPSAFHRSISCDSNLFNNKTGFTQPISTLPPPVAQVAPIRGQHSEPLNPYNNQMSRSKCLPLTESTSSAEGFHPPAHSSPVTSHPHDLKSNGISSGNGNQVGKRGVHLADAQCQSPLTGEVAPQAKSLMLMVSPLRFEASTMTTLKTTSSTGPMSPSVEISKSPVLNNKSEVSFRVNCTSDASSQTDSGNEEESESDLTMAIAGQLPCQLVESRSQGSGSLTSTSSSASSASSTSSSSSGSPTMQMQSSNELLTMMGIGKTGNGIGSEGSASPTTSSSSYVGRQKSQEELDCEELSRDLAKQLPQGDKLQTLLVPLPEHKTSADYMEGLFHLEMKLTNDQLENHSKCRRSSSSSPELPIQNNQHLDGHDTSSIYESQATMESTEKFTTTIHKRCNGHAPLPADSAYFTTSECKAKFLTQYVKDMHNESSVVTNGVELVKQKEELVSRISRKLEILRIEQSEIQEEIQSNELLGHTVVDRVKQTAKRNEFDKFKLHVEAIEKITSLLLGLSGRLARAENALMGLVNSSNPQEKKTLESKRDKLKEQLDEAKVLKENIDKRSAQVAEFLQKYLTVDEYADYDHFTKMKAKLIIDAREIDEKIKLGEEQMKALQETLNTLS